MLSNNAMLERMVRAMSSIIRHASHSRSNSKHGCMFVCMLCLERNLTFDNSAEKGWIMARYLPAMR